MRFQIKNPQDFFAGLLFLAFGLAAIYFARGYTIGTAARMGPGYFPLALGIILSALGAFLAARAAAVRIGGGAIGRVALRPLLLILLAVATFGLLLDRAGFLIAAFAAMMVAATAGNEFKVHEALIVAVVMTGLCWLIFVIGLKLTFPVLPPFLTR
jgi:hypothetical protein